MQGARTQPHAPRPARNGRYATTSCRMLRDYARSSCAQRRHRSACRYRMRTLDCVNISRDMGSVGEITANAIYTDASTKGFAEAAVRHVPSTLLPILSTFLIHRCDQSPFRKAKISTSSPAVRAMFNVRSRMRILMSTNDQPERFPSPKTYVVEPRDAQIQSRQRQIPNISYHRPFRGLRRKRFRMKEWLCRKTTNASKPKQAKSSPTNWNESRTIRCCVSCCRKIINKANRRKIAAVLLFTIASLFSQSPFHRLE